MSLPEPKYYIGCQVWEARTDLRRKALPCPDCLGTKKWEVKTPAEEVFQIDCPRCSTLFSRLPAPELMTWEPVVRSLTIGSIQINTAERDGRDMVQYMCLETGVGSGTVYRESRLFASESEAMVAAQSMALGRNSEEPTLSTIQKAEAVAHMRFTNAAIDEARAAEREARFRLQDAHFTVFDKTATDSEIVAKLRQDLETVPA